MMAERSIANLENGGACGLYVHIPFCQTKCGYCDFYSVPLGDRPTAPLVEAVKRELFQRTANLEHPIATVFVGGGTPTLLPTGQLADLLAAIGEATKGHAVRGDSRHGVADYPDGSRHGVANYPDGSRHGVANYADGSRHGVADYPEWTVEANPATVDDEKAAILRRAGVTRVSMGAQSFIPAELAALERLHNPDDIPASVKTLRRAAIDNVNLDLIFGIPGQTIDTWRRSLESAIALQPEHVSCYALTYEPGTRLTAQRRAGRVVPCDEDLEVDLFEFAVETLAAAGFVQYEISNYARPGRRCLHNLLYWRNQPYVGVGPSAAGCLRRRRYKNVSDVAAYVREMDRRGCAEGACETLDDEMMLMEMVMMQLRLVDGLSRSMVKQRLGLDPVERFGKTLDRYGERGMLTVSDEAVALTDKGRFMADAIITDLVAEAPSTALALPVLSP